MKKNILNVLHLPLFCIYYLANGFFVVIASVVFVRIVVKNNFSSQTRGDYKHSFHDLN